jgi:hypothetical protein
MKGHSGLWRIPAIDLLALNLRLGTPVLVARVDGPGTVKLSEVTVYAYDTDGPAQGALVRIFNGVDGSGSQWVSAWSDSDGNATFYLVAGSYGYRVEKDGYVYRGPFRVEGHGDDQRIEVDPPAEPTVVRVASFAASRVSSRLFPTAIALAVLSVTTPFSIIVRWREDRRAGSDPPSRACYG